MLFAPTKGISKRGGYAKCDVSLRAFYPLVLNSYSGGLFRLFIPIKKLFSKKSIYTAEASIGGVPLCFHIFCPLTTKVKILLYN